LIGDHNSTSIARLNQISDTKIEKIGDRNHVRKGIVNDLYKMQKTFKELTSTVITHLVKSITYAMSQNK